MIINIITLLLLLLTIFICIYINSRLYIYIKKLEEIVQKQVDKNENMFQSLKEIIQEDYLLNDGRLKKFLYQKNNNNLIYNGINVTEEGAEF